MYPGVNSVEMSLKLLSARQWCVSLVFDSLLMIFLGNWIVRHGSLHRCKINCILLLSILMKTKDIVPVNLFCKSLNKALLLCSI